jgi:hypothetical protein
MIDLTALDHAPFSFDVYAVPGYNFAGECQRMIHRMLGGRAALAHRRRQ